MAAGSNNNNFSAESPISISEFSDEDSIAGNGNLAIKQVVRKRAPIFPFEPEDHYVPDNNSNNIIPKVNLFKVGNLDYRLQSIPSQTGKSNLALREVGKDISGILWHFFFQEKTIAF